MKINKCIASLALLGLLLFSCSDNPISINKVSEDKVEMLIGKPKKYVLLPVQENCREIQMTVYRDKDEPVNLYVRLAADQVDYYVPYEVAEKTDKLKIEYTGTPESMQSVQWDKIEISDSFDMENREKYRPVYHYTPKYGWMNDPNGLVYQDGEYHLFYQWNPYGSMWGNMHWGHAVSRDLVHWDYLGMAIAPDSLGTIFSGNCIIDKENVAGFGKNAMIAYYTSAGKKQTQSVAYSLDNGRTFTKYHKNPIVTSEDKVDFRDPNVFYHEPSRKWIMVIAAGQEVDLFSSVNLLDWEYESSFGEGYGNHDGVWECPDLLELAIDSDPKNKKWVLLLNINPGGIFKGSATQYFTGSFDGKNFTCDSDPSVVKWMDWGKDHYATITWSNAPLNRSLAIAWMSNWEYANNVPTTQYRSGNSVPREISLFTKGNELYLRNQPVEELKALRKSTQEYKFTVSDQYKSYTIDSVLEDNKGAFELEIEWKNGSAEIFGFNLFNEQGENVSLYYDLSEGRFYMDRTRSGDINFSEHFPAITYAPVDKGGLYSLRIFVDLCSIECFGDDGKFVMTNLVFPQEPYNRINFYTKNGSVDVESLKIYKLDL